MPGRSDAITSDGSLRNYGDTPPASHAVADWSGRRRERGEVVREMARTDPAGQRLRLAGGSGAQNEAAKQPEYISTARGRC